MRANALIVVVLLSGGSKTAVKQARGGDLGAAAITALAENDQVLATFLAVAVLAPYLDANSSSSGSILRAKPLD